MHRLPMVTGLLLVAALAVGCDRDTTTSPPGEQLAPPQASVIVSGGSAPMITSTILFGGAGDQRGAAVAVNNGELYAAGWTLVGGLHGVLVKFDTPPAVPLWSLVEPNTHFSGLALGAGVPYAVGQAAPPTCGASDGAGDTERKTLLARYDGAGFLLGCRSENFFPYRGIEYYLAAVGVTEAGTPYVYAAGQAEQTGFSNSFPFVLAKYDAGGSLVAAVTEPGIGLGTFSGCCPGESNVIGLTELAGGLYLAGQSRLPGFGESNVRRPVLMRYTAGLSRDWKVRPQDNPGGVFNGVTSLGAFLYAVGQAGFSSGADYLVEKYDVSGNRVWSMTSGGAAEDVFTGAVAVGDRLFAVGYTRSAGAGGADAVVLEIDPSSGATTTTTLLGAGLDDFANGVATDGSDLYVVGETRSYATPAGNAVGQNDLVLWHLAFAPVITAVTVPTDPVGFPTPVSVTWAFTDPGTDTWTCEISWDTGGALEPASYVAPQSCSATRSLAPGVYAVTVRVSDSGGGADEETATSYIVVYDPTGGFATGGGWIDSPEEAFVADPGLTGKATFGFVSKYQKGAQTPSGNTEFQFHAAGMSFNSVSYQWLVVAGSLAQYKGEGTINGDGGYGFLLTARDGQAAGGGGVDQFRIKIWDSSSNVVYDNQTNAPEDSGAATDLGGGSIVIHTKK